MTSREVSSVCAYATCGSHAGEARTAAAAVDRIRNSRRESSLYSVQAL